MNNCDLQVTKVENGWIVGRNSFQNGTIAMWVFCDAQEMAEWIAKLDAGWPKNKEGLMT